MENSLKRTTRASRGEHTSGINVSKSIPTPNKTRADFTSLKVRKWKKVLVRLGQIKILRWVAERDQPTSELQLLKNQKILVKKPGKRGRKRVLVKGAKQEILEEINFDEAPMKRRKQDDEDTSIADMDRDDGDEDGDDCEDQDLVNENLDE